MPCLLTLPREIRDKILELVICDERAPPPNPTAASSDRTLLNDIECRSWHYGPWHNKYEGQGPNGAYTTNSIALLLANRQLSAETQDALERLPTTYSYGLDVMFVDEKELWPTWVSVPALSPRVDSVVATFRIFGTWDGEGRFPFRLGDGSPPEIVWCFYSLMERFLTCGPVGKRKLQYLDRNITVKFLTLNILTPPGLEPVATDDMQTYGHWYRSRIDHYYISDDEEDDDDAARTAGTNIPMQPALLADFLYGYICHLLGMGYHTAREGGIMYERIGTIRICVDGELKHECDLGEYLARLRFTNALQTFGNVYPPENRVPFFWQWKKRALEMRKEAGLSMVEPKDPELLQL